MATESVIWTALPHGMTDDGRLRLTAFVSPRLSTDGAGSLPLGDFRAFRDWPLTCSRLKFAVEFQGVGVFEAGADPQTDAPQSALWQLLCRKGNVIDHAFTDLSKRPMRSLQVRNLVNTVLGLYTQVAETAPTAFPPVLSGPLADMSREFGHLADAKNEFYPILDRYMAQEAGPGGKRGRYLVRSAIPPSMRTGVALAEAYRFYDRPGMRDPAGPDQVPDPPKPPAFDFHKFCAVCADYPVLLRRLGLAIDLVVRRTPAMGTQGQVRVVVADAPAEFAPWMAADQARPWTNYQIAGRRFLPRPKDKAADLVDGMLRLESEAFLVNQIDVDGSAMKTVDFFANVARLAAHLGSQARSMSEDASSLPALRTGGFTIARDDRAARLVRRLDDVADHEDKHKGGAAAALFAEDVTRGYRVDVEDQTAKPDRWLSLCHRTGTYTAKRSGEAAVAIDTITDEGYVKSASSTSQANDDTLYLHETLFGWEGWSLVAKRPGPTIVDNAVDTPEPNNTTEFPLITQFVPRPGTLPRLRFKRTYRFRARAVDLAGNSVPEKDIVKQHTTRPHTFLRFEPVPSPAVVPRRPFTEGESLMRMVIRSTLGYLPAAYVAQPRIAGLAGHTTPLSAYLATNERHLAAPQCSQQFAEWHGKFDAAFGPAAAQADIDENFDIAALESGTFLDPAPGAFVVNPDPAAATDLATRNKGAPLKPGEYVCHDVDELALPYLPDPLSFGASFTSLPGKPGTHLQPWAVGKWPDVQPFRILIQDGSGAPSFADRLLTVSLPQAEMVTVRLASYMKPADLELMGVWMREQSATRSAQQTDAEQGRHWMLTPWQPLTLVHAVEKPLTPPVVNVPTDGITRHVGETFAVLAGTIDNHAKSTGRLDIAAKWTEPVDDLAAGAPSVLDGQAHVADFLIEASEAACRIGRDEVAPSSAQVAVHRVRHEFRDTKHRWVDYHAVATTRFREYFPPAITNDASLITHVGAEVRRNVPSSRRPDPPEILYIVPTWTWKDRTVRGLSFPGSTRRLAPMTLRTRSGGGLRVYLDRPWYSSGDDELLGVVLEDQPWLTFPIDATLGITATAFDRAQADAFALKVFEAGLAKGAGAQSAPPAQRLINAITRVTKPAPRLPRVRADATPDMLTALAFDAAFAMPEANAVPEAPGDATAISLELVQQDALAGILGNLFLPSGDPQKFVTHWGVDPIWSSNPPAAGPYIHQFPLRTAVGTGISLLEAPGHMVTVVGHKPEFDPLRKLWYCDLQLDAGTSYFPFVRLALARYQPYSIDGQHLSRVVFPDFTQLVAERRAGFTRLGRTSISVSLRGPAGFTENAVDLAPIWSGPSLDLEARLRLSRFAVAQFERRADSATSDLAWVPVGDEVRLDLSAPGGAGDIRYSRTLTRPSVAEGNRLRLALREYEVFQTDESEADDHFVAPSSWGPFTVVERPVRYRLVYATHFDL